MRKPLLAMVLAATMAVAGSAAADEPSSPLTFTIEAHTTGMDFVGLVPEGIRFDGYVVVVGGDGIFAGATGSATDYLLIRHDGVGATDVRAFVVLADGAPFAMKASGFLGDPTIMPPLAAWLDPDFEVADADIPYHGVAWFQTMAPQYAFMNYTVFGFRGAINFATGVLRITYFSLAE